MNMEAKKAAEYILGKTGGKKPQIALVLGSGLGDYAKSLENAVHIPYKDIPGFVTSTAPGHAGEWITGDVGGKTVCLMAGRLHFYEGYTMQQVTFPVRVMKHLGVEVLFLTNASGSLNLTYFPGDFMLLRDHINFSGNNPLIGPNDNDEGLRFPDMTYAYDQQLMEVAREAANKHGITLREGTYMFCTGPNLETPAEVRMLRAMGGDAVGMSTVPEALVARHVGLRVIAISCITNFGAGVKDTPLVDGEVDAAGKKAAPKLRKLVDEIIANI